MKSSRQEPTVTTTPQVSALPPPLLLAAPCGSFCAARPMRAARCALPSTTARCPPPARAAPHRDIARPSCATDHARRFPRCDPARRPLRHGAFVAMNLDVNLDARQLVDSYLGGQYLERDATSPCQPARGAARAPFHGRPCGSPRLPPLRPWQARAARLHLWPRRFRRRRGHRRYPTASGGGDGRRRQAAAGGGRRRQAAAGGGRRQAARPRVLLGSRFGMQPVHAHAARGGALADAGRAACILRMLSLYVLYGCSCV